MLGTDAQPILANHLRDLGHRAGRFKSKIANDDERFIDQHPRPFFQFRQRNTRIDIAIIVCAPDDNVRSVFGSRAEKSADAVGRRRHFFDDFLELLDHASRLDDRLFVI